MKPCNRINYSTVYWRLTMFQAAYRSSSGALTVFAASGLHTHVVTGRGQVWVGTEFPLRLDYGRSPHGKHPKASNICIVTTLFENFDCQIVQHMYCKDFVWKFRLPNCPTKTDFLAFSFPSHILHIFTVYGRVSVLMQNECTILNPLATNVIYIWSTHSWCF